MLDLLIDALTYRKVILSISHSNYLSAVGGVEKVIRAEQQFLNEHGVSYIHLFPMALDCLDAEGIFPLVGLNIDGETVGSFNGQAMDFGIKYLQMNHDIELLAVHVHHLMNWPYKSVQKLISGLVSPHSLFFVHDFFSVCKQYSLLYNDVEYCGAPPNESAKCVQCTYGRNGQRKEHLNQIREFFSLMSEFIVPSEIAQQIFLGTFPDLMTATVCVPHQKVLISHRKTEKHDSTLGLFDKLRVAYVGHQLFHKGWGTWVRLVERSNPEDSTFFAVGSAVDQLQNVQQISTSYANDDNHDTLTVLRDLKIDIAVLWSLCQETYSFTAFESLAAGCYILTNRSSGNIAALVDRYSCGRIFATEEELLSYFADLAKVRSDVSAYQRRRMCIALENETGLLQKEISTPNEKIFRIEPWLLAIIHESAETIDRQTTTVLQEWERHRTTREDRDRLLRVVADREKQISDYQTIVADREQQIAAIAADRERQIGDYRTIVADREKQIGEYRLVFADREKQIGEYRLVVADRERQIAELCAIVAEKESEIEAYRSSMSWRMTKPLRTTMKYYRSISRPKA